MNNIHLYMPHIDNSLSKDYRKGIGLEVHLELEFYSDYDEDLEIFTMFKGVSYMIDNESEVWAQQTY